MNVQLTPWQGCIYGAVVGIGVEQLVWVAVPSMVTPLLPEPRAIQIRLGDTEKGERSDGERKLEEEEDAKCLWSLPFLWHSGETRPQSHGGRIRLLQRLKRRCWS